jgi:TonB-dependent SusC/RagA subfamily outer membrane receptor
LKKYKNNMNKIYCVLTICLLNSCANYGSRSVASTDREEKTINDGYSSKSGRNFTGSAEEIKELGSNITLDNYLRRVSGVTVQGDGANAKVTVRGINSFVSNPDPLYIINGTAINGGYATIYNMVNPVDIKSVTVLKDAGSTAIYGSRGANGVIVVSLKTKR